MQIKFVNRSREYSFLENQGKEIGYSTNIVMVCGDSGVGKSELTRNFLNLKSEQFPSVKISIQRAEKNAYSSGYYIIKLAREIHELALKDERIHSLPDFFRSGSASSAVLKKLGNNFRTDVADLIPFGNSAKGVWDLLFSTGDFNTNSLFESTHSDILLTLFQYVYNECSRTSLIINIENIQSIDHWSLELLGSIVQSSLGCMYLLEFTENDNTGYSFGEIVSTFEKTNISIKPLIVEPLALKDIQLIMADHPEISWELMKNSYVNWNGNMRLLVDVLAKIRYGLPVDKNRQIDISSATEDHLLSLSSSQLFLLIVIAAHQEPAEKNLIKKLTTFREATIYLLDVESVLQSLFSRALIKYDGSLVMLAHDSIQQQAPTIGRYELFVLIAQRFWLEVYENLLSNADLFSSRGWLLMKVLKFSSLLGLDNKVVSMLEIINTEALRSRDPEKMIAYVQDVKTSLIERDTVNYRGKISKINIWLIEIWFKLGNSQLAWQILSENHFSGKLFKVLKSILLEQIGHHLEAIAFCSKELENAEVGTNFDLSLRLVRLVTNYEIGNLQNSKNEFFSLYGNTKYTNLLEYGFLLRNAELIYNYRESLPFYVESINHFIKFNAKRQAAFSRITYGVHLGLLGYYNEAEQQFRLSEEELGDQITEMHTLYNNLAVIQLSQGILSGNSEELLRKAMFNATGDFDRLTIAMNYLVLMDWSGRNSEAEIAISTMKSILIRPSFANSEILRYAYFDLFKYYEKINDQYAAAEYRNKIDLLGLEETPIWKFWLHGDQISTEDEDYCLSHRDRAMSFLCNWNMEYDSSLMQYE